MAGKKQEGKMETPDCVCLEVIGQFDAKAAEGLISDLERKLKGKNVAGARIDFSSATHITASGIDALRQLVGRLSLDGQGLTVCGMRSEMYKALKVAGVSDGLTFGHQTASSPDR